MPSLDRTPRMPARERRALGGVASGFVPYTGAIANLDMGLFTLYTLGLITGRYLNLSGDEGIVYLHATDEDLDLITLSGITGDPKLYWDESENAFRVDKGFIAEALDADGLVIGATAGGAITDIKNEDNLVSNSQTALATQQSIKAYVDASILTQEEVEDFAGALIANATGTHTGISITYQDGTDDIDFIIDHDAATNFEANEHYLQTAITNVSTALATGLLKVTTGTGALTVITDSSTNWDAAFTHVSNNGTDHSFIDQSVLVAASPTFAGLTIGALAGVLKAAAGVVSGGAALNDLGDVNAAAPNNNDSLTWDTGTSKWIPEAVAGAGETNTCSSSGSGVSVYYQKTGVDIELNAIKSENNRLSVILDGATHDIELTVVEGNIDHNALANYDANKHIDHTGVNITAGYGLTGGGDISTTRTLTVDIMNRVWMGC